VTVAVRTQEKPKIIPKRTKEGEPVAHVQVKSTVQKKDLNLAQSAALIALKEGKGMQVIDDGKNSMRDMLKVVIQNYALYYQCAEKTHGWQDWYGQQKKIHESVR
jgi:hypothetical protein